MQFFFRKLYQKSQCFLAVASLQRLYACKKCRHAELRAADESDTLSSMLYMFDSIEMSRQHLSVRTVFARAGDMTGHDMPTSDQIEC